MAPKRVGVVQKQKGKIMSYRSFFTRESFVPEKFSLHVHKAEIGLDAYLYEVSRWNGSTGWYMVAWTSAKQTKPTVRNPRLKHVGL